MDEVFLTELGQSQLTRATFDFDGLFDDDLGESGIGFEGECLACALLLTFDDQGLCERCADKLERDLIRERQWDYTATGFVAPVLLFVGARKAELSGGIIPGIFRGTSGLWALQGVTRAYFGGSSDIPVPGDYNGNGRWDLGIFRPASGLWAVRGVTRAYFGGSSDSPIPGGYAGDGTDDVGIFRGTSGLWAIRGVTRSYFGTVGDVPVTR